MNGGKLLKKKRMLSIAMKSMALLIIFVYFLMSAQEIAKVNSISNAAYQDFITPYRIATERGSALYGEADTFVALLAYSNFSSSIKYLSNASCARILQLPNGTYVALQTMYNITCGMPIVYYPNETELIKEYGMPIGQGIFRNLIYAIKVVKSPA